MSLEVSQRAQRGQETCGSAQPGVALFCSITVISFKDLSEGHGVLVYLPQEGRGIGLAEKIKAYALQEKGLDTVEANLALGYKADMRDYGVGIQILKDLGLTNVRLLTNNPKKTEAFDLRGFDLTVIDQVPILPAVNEHNLDYLRAKRDKLGHRLPSD